MFIPARFTFYFLFLKFILVPGSDDDVPRVANNLLLVYILSQSCRKCLVRLERGFRMSVEEYLPNQIRR